MKMKTIVSLCLMVGATLARAGNSMNADSSTIYPQSNVNLSNMSTVNVAKTAIVQVTYPCASYQGQYGIPYGATVGKFIINVESSTSNSKYGQVVYSNVSGCSVGSQPVVSVNQCSAYGGQYGLPSIIYYGFTLSGYFTITTEGNPYKSNYGAVLSVNTSGCVFEPLFFG